MSKCKNAKMFFVCVEMQLQKCENVGRNLTEFLNSERCRSGHGAPSFRYSSRPRCFAAAWWFRLRSRVLRRRLPEACFLVFRLESQGATGTARAACLAHLLFSTSPGLAALPRSDGFFSWAVCLVRRTLSRSAFHGFSIGFKRCRSVYIFIISFSISVLFSQKTHKCKSCRSRQAHLSQISYRNTK